MNPCYCNERQCFCGRCTKTVAWRVGEIDILGGISYTDERAQNMLFSDMPMGGREILHL